MSDIIASTYEIKMKIGQGGGGTVYLARHLRLDKDVVLKADKRKITTKKELLEREVSILKNLSHSYIPQVYDFFVEDDTVYTVIDYIKGESLDKPLKRGERFSQAQVIKWARQLLEALAYLHSPTHGDPPRGYVHSDIKPANLMRTPSGDICLIDFNIALAIGEENIVGLSAGYASPEHYGQDYSSLGLATEPRRRSGSSFLKRRAVRDTDKYAWSGESEEQTGPGLLDEDQEETEPLQSGGSWEETEPLQSGGSWEETTPLWLGGDGERVQPTPVLLSQSGSSTGARRIMPDVRSDIYSTGATLYHLLSGKRPAADARDVEPLSKDEFSPLIVDIIAKAMNPNPDLRYQTAAEMLAAFDDLRKNDPRILRLKRTNRWTTLALAALFVMGVCTAFIGLKRMETTESWLKLVEYSRNALRAGDSSGAVDYALEAIPERSGILTPPVMAGAQSALADALGVYDLSDGFKDYRTVQLPSQPLFLAMAPDGMSAACVYSGALMIFDTERCEQLAVLPAAGSALSEAAYFSDDEVVFAGEDGITAYDISREEVIWTGEPATNICVSADGCRAAAIYKDENCARVYDTTDGGLLMTVDFGENRQRIPVNDVAANPNDDLFALNADGTLLAVSFANGGVHVFDLQDGNKDISVLDQSECIRFEGGFCGRYMAFSAGSKDQSSFEVIDIRDSARVISSSSSALFHVQCSESGIYLSNQNLLVEIDPETGGQKEIAYTERDITAYHKNGAYTAVATDDDSFAFYGPNASLLAKHEGAMRGDFLRLCGAYAVIGNMDSPILRVLKLENHAEAQLMSYDPEYDHNEARISADGKTVMLFRYDQFRIYTSGGELLTDVRIPDAKQVYDQQFVREDGESRLEVTYYSGLVRSYSTADGSLISKVQGDAPDESLDEEYTTDKLLIKVPLHGAAEAYSLDSGQLVAILETDDYLTYVTQVGEYVITEYMTALGERYGLLLNDDCEVLARIPKLCDILEDGELVIDDMLGNLRHGRIYSIEELITLAQQNQ